MNSIDDSLALDNPLSAFADRSEGFKIYTHSARTRLIILAIFVFYLFMFGFFVKFLAGKIAKLDEAPSQLEMLTNHEMTRWLSYGISGAGLLIATTFLIFFLWWVVDIWGLQVWVNPVEIRVQNTLTGPISAVGPGPEKC